MNGLKANDKKRRVQKFHARAKNEIMKESQAAAVQFSKRSVNKPTAKNVLIFGDADEGEEKYCNQLFTMSNFC